MNSNLPNAEVQPEIIVAPAVAEPIITDAGEIQLLAEAFRRAPIGTALISRQGRFLHTNPAFSGLFGHSEAELTSLNLDALIHPEDLNKDEESMRLLLEDQVPSYHVEKRLRHISGQWLWGSLHFSLVRDDKDRALYSVCQAHDITARKEAEAELQAQNHSLVLTNKALTFDKEVLEAQAHDDRLTGLKNRRAFDERLREEVARSRRTEVGFSLFLLDIDHFKKFNYDWGHGKGDEVLRQFAGLLKKTLRTADTVARFGGEEFALILPSTGALGSYRAAERCREAIAEHNWNQGAVTVSCGATTWIEGDDETTMLAKAELALKQAKDAGRDRVRHSEFQTGA